MAFKKLKKTMKKQRNLSETRETMLASTSQSALETGQDALEEQTEEAETMMECSICCEPVLPQNVRVLVNCGHKYCDFCVLKHIAYSIYENRIEIPCPECSAFIHPSDVKRNTLQNPELMRKYEEFSVRNALILIPDARWCPAPNCGFAAIVPNGGKCPKIKCRRPTCKTDFCFDCLREWHPGRKCSESKEVLMEGDCVELRACPRCQTKIMKLNDGSCNHMHCTMCKAEFCWLCLREINEFHYMAPTGCTFWGRAQWTRKKKLMWQLGSLIGSPVVIAATAVVSIPLIIGGVPYTVGKGIYKKMRNKSKAKRVLTTAAAVTGSAILSPAIAGVAVVIGVPLAVGYTYTVIPKAIILDAIAHYRDKPRPLKVDNPFVSQPIPTSPPAPVEYLNADGSAPGPSSSVTSSDYSEDISSIASDVATLGLSDAEI